ncbi:Gm14862 [Phodopus roborovskii]|uniref:Gm14862 protein n=1 Tax=Phodopus roborovskii TaxID=109678 RepID=A0AAU9Z0U0_PHORO|nr:Gm14862 [Phodopus roborovskii]
MWQAEKLRHSLCASEVKGPVFRQQCVGDLEHRGTNGPVRSLSRWSLQAQVASCNSVPVP